MKIEELLPLKVYPLTLIQTCSPLENKLLGNGKKLPYMYIDGMESFSLSVYFCKITTGVLNRNMRTVYRVNDAGELTICIKFLLSCLNVLGKFYIFLV